LTNSPARLSQPADCRAKPEKSGSGRQLAILHPIHEFLRYVQNIIEDFKQSPQRKPVSRLFTGTIVWRSQKSGIFTQSDSKQYHKQDAGMLILAKTSASASELREAAVPLSNAKWNFLNAFPVALGTLRDSGRAHSTNIV